METSERPQKRRRLSHDCVSPASVRQQRASFLSSLSRSITPPQATALRKRDGSSSASQEESVLHPQSSLCVRHGSQVRNPDKTSQLHTAPGETLTEQATFPKKGTESVSLPPGNEVISGSKTVESSSVLIPSPFQLTYIRDLPDAYNKDTIRLGDILGDPLIEEAWIFNYCFDVDFVMQHFDPDVRQLVKVKIVHGSWRNEDLNKKGIDEACLRWPNVSPLQAYIPDPFGTHHSKMFILFRHDDCAQLIIHTANMLAKDWTNMTQAVWKSPLLPLNPGSVKSDSEPDSGTPGTGKRFKSDLLAYLKSYGSKLRTLPERVQQYSFEAVRGALVASTPSKVKSPGEDTRAWGYPALKRVLQHIATLRPSSQDSHIVCQVSSIAKLPSEWMKAFLETLSGVTSRARTSIVFPTPEDVQHSLDGYAAGGSIHIKAQSAQHRKPIDELRPKLCRWTRGPESHCRSDRNLAAPHIKTYIKFARRADSENPAPDIEWALLTSANLSTQAWGVQTKGDARDSYTVHVQSYEIGVLVWPELYLDEVAKRGESSNGVARMVPLFGQDTPSSSTSEGLTLTKGAQEGTPIVDAGVVVGIRMPYDLPLTPYGTKEMPWSPQSVYDKPDTHGRTWPPNDKW